MRVNLKNLKVNILTLRQIQTDNLSEEEKDSLYEAISILNNIVRDIELDDECVIEDSN